MAREIAAAISTAFVIAFAQVVNDIIDRDLDARDKPGRPLPSGQLSPATAGFVAAICAVAGLLFAFLARPVLVPFALVVLVLSWAYSQFWKSTVLIGNIVVATLASMTVVYGAISSGGELGSRLLWIQLMIFAVVLAHEVVKTTRDVEGDAAADVTTIATRFGVRHAARLGAVLCLISVPIAAVPSLQASHPVLYLAVVGMGLMLPSLLAGLMLALRTHAVRDIAMPFTLLRVAWGGMVCSLLLL